MWPALAVAALLAHLIAHEGAHALALRKLGGNIREAGLGLPFPPRLRATVNVPARDRAAPSRPLVLSLSPWLIAAYVEPDEQALTLLARCPYRDRAWFAGAGVIANLLLSDGLLAFLFAVNGALVAAFVTVGVGAVLWFGRKLITAALPVLGVGALALLVAGLIGSGGKQHGPVGLVRLVAQTNGPQALLIMSAAIGVSLAILNCVPVFPFDGGRVTDAALQGLFGDKVAGRFRAVTGMLAFSLVLYAVVSDWL